MTAAVVTGIGVAAPNGLGKDKFWAATLRGESGIGTVRRFDVGRYPSRLGGEIGDFEPTDHLAGRLIPQTDRMTQLALAASDWALVDAGVQPGTYDTAEMGVATSGASGGLEYGQRELDNLWGAGPEHVSVYMSFAWFYAVNSGQISIRHGMRGPGGSIVADQAGGLDAMAKARRHLRDGSTLMLTGGIDGSLCPWAWICLIGSGRVTGVLDPRHAFLPFDQDASGHVPGEGGALIVLEHEDTARERGIDHSYGEFVGYAATFDAHPSVTARPGLQRAAELALQDARMTADQIDVVFADASGTPELDRTEAEVIASVFGPRAVPVTAPKTMTGRLLAGAAPLDVANAVLAMRDSAIPPTVNISRNRHADVIDLVRDQPREAQLRSALVLARGHGGFNSAVVIKNSR